MGGGIVGGIGGGGVGGDLVGKGGGGFKGFCVIDDG